MLGGVEPGEAEVSGIRDMNTPDGCGMLRERVPDRQRRIDAARAIAQCGGAIVEAWLGRAAGTMRFDQYHLAAAARERQCQAGPNHSAADDGDLTKRLGGVHRSASGRHQRLELVRLLGDPSCQHFGQLGAW